MNRCTICDATIRVGGDGLCNVCRNEIKKARWQKVFYEGDGKEVIEKTEHYGINHIDTSKADYYSRINNE